MPCAGRGPRTRSGSRPWRCARCRSAGRLSGRRPHTAPACAPRRSHGSEGGCDHDWSGARHTDRGSSGAGAVLAAVRGCDYRARGYGASRSGWDCRRALPGVRSRPARIPGWLSLPARPVRPDRRSGRRRTNAAGDDRHRPTCGKLPRRPVSAAEIVGRHLTPARVSRARGLGQLGERDGVAIRIGNLRVPHAVRVGLDRFVRDAPGGEALQERVEPPATTRVIRPAPACAGFGSMKSVACSSTSQRISSPARMSGGRPNSRVYQSMPASRSDTGTPAMRCVIVLISGDAATVLATSSRARVIDARYAFPYGI
jgi:hypothetical protein